MRIYLGLLACGMAALGFHAPQSRVILPHPAKMNDSLQSQGWPRARVNETCAACHVEIASEWQQSRHHLAYENEAFQRSLARESRELQPFCQSCHAPEANPLLPPSKLVADMGIGCVTCHAPRGPILGANENANAPHDVLKSVEFASDAACANCHEFLFPGASGKRGLHMQRTMTEHSENAQDQRCTDCHMPKTNGNRPHKDHRFPGGYDTSLWQKALDIRAERLSATEIRVSLEPRDVTHAVPTGDLFRRIAIEVIPDKPEAKPPAPVYLARHFDRGSVMREVSDNRVLKASRTLTIDVPVGELTIRVQYERVANHRSPNERDANVESRLLLKEIRLAQ